MSGFWCADLQSCFKAGFELTFPFSGRRRKGSGEQGINVGLPFLPAASIAKMALRAEIDSSMILFFFFLKTETIGDLEDVDMSVEVMFPGAIHLSVLVYSMVSCIQLHSAIAFVVLKNCRIIERLELDGTFKIIW